ncbi:hypothetical protein ILUMI_03263 [Ignelater luminosus]|uniref:Uncharacterized protein n=1 Tax=Ignelater luminosus TaxID=2038154 RepID=A0A8K0DM54_IGNLU|nr:hypothetical protein ILUMI_03263 [Ignelater luminosus]
MESSGSTPQEIPNEENSSIVSNPEPSKELECSEKVSKSDVEIKREITTKPKRVSFHFGSNTNNNDDKNVILSTIQNIYDSKTEETSLARNNLSKSRINKSAYIKLHRHSFSSTGNSSVDKLKGRYEYIAKQQTDNNLKANIGTRAKANSDKSSTNDVKNSFESDKQTEGEHEKGNAQNLKSTEVLKSEFINSPKSEPKEEPTKFTTSSEKETKSCENLLLKTTSNIEKLQNNLSTKLSSDTIEKLRTKYSPASYGYPRETSASKIPKKVQFQEEQPTKIPVPTPRVKSQTEKKETQNKDNQEPKENLNKKEIQTVTVKLVSVPEPAGKIIDSIDISKDENSNTIVTNDPNSSEIKRVKPALPLKPKLPERIPEETLQKSSENQLEQITGVEIEVTYDNIEFAEPEDKHFIERHSSSEDSVDKLESFFSEIVMDKKPKEKKRSNSFKRMLTGGLFGRDKKKSEEDKSKHKKKDNAIFADNAQNESQAFDRNSSLRHTIDNSYPRRDSRGNNTTYHSSHSSGSGPLYYYSPPPQLRKPPDDASLRNRYTEMKGSFISNNHPSYSPEDYVPMDNGNLSKAEIPQRTYMNVNKYIDTSSSSSNTLESENRNCTYQNALIAQAEMRQIRENENLHRNSQKSGIPINLSRKNSPGFQENRYLNIEKHSNSPEMFRDTIQDSTQSLQLVKPKALIPINSERPLPNPYHNNQDKIDSLDSYESFDDKTLDRNLNVDNLKPYPHKNNLYARTNNATEKINNRPVVVEEIYGTVFDSITPQNSPQTNFDYLRTRSLSPEQSRRSSSSPSCKSPTSPRSLEASKLRLPPNREKVELQPRIKSPIPQVKVSTDKIIATELLRKTSPIPEKTTTKLQRSPHASPIRSPTMMHGNTPENQNQSNRSPMTSPKAHSTPQAASQSNNDYVCLRKKPSTSPKEESPVDRFSPREVSAAECLEAAEWQRQQRELDKSPALESPQQITTDVLVHVNPEEQYIIKNNYPSPSSTLRQQSPVNHMHFQQVSPRSAFSSLNNVRPQTPLQQSIPSPNSKSPDKQHMLQNVEAFYWRELRKLKDREEQDLLRYRQQQLYVYGYVEDPVLSRRSRSVSPSAQRGRRSLSLPRDSRPIPNTTIRPVYIGPEIIPEGRPVIAKKPIQLPTESAYGQVRQPLQRNPNFIRNTFERSTIGPIGTNRQPQLYENYYPKQGYQPIFKRGSLTSNVPISDTQLQASKKVSFSNRQNSNNQQVWPTKNGFTRSPPTRRVDREISMDDEVFLPNTPNTPKTPKTPQNRNSDERYAYYSNIPQTSQQQQIYQNATGRDPMYVSRIPRTETDYPDKRVQEGLYGRTGSRQITVSNKVCDIYGQIHETNQSPKKSGLPPAGVSQNYGQIKQMGLMYGQLQQNPNNVTVGRSFNHLNSPPQSNFVRGTRLTASVNDMYKRYSNERARYEVDPRYQTRAMYTGEKVIDAPNRPLPPLPERKDTRGLLLKKNVSGYVPISDTESGSEAGEVQRILQSGVRQKNFSVIGK